VYSKRRIAALRSYIAMAVVAAVVFLLGAAGSPESAAQDRLPRVAQGLVLFETNVLWPGVSGKWRGRRDAWIADVRAASMPRELANYLVELETAMGWNSVEDSWRRRRNSWIEEMKTAETAGDVANGLLELEAATLWSAVSHDWRRLRDPWVARLKAIQ
jgi:hypothetical protein